MTNANFSKVSGWLGGLLVAVGGSGYLGPKWGPLATALGAVMTASGIHGAAATDGHK